ncbi:MAG: DUF1365 domain-containing protein [Alphaproteobacteria bacterium]|nr:DUF1365 domain-containing protein [Alphaproteobacteria bacterium]
MALKGGLLIADVFHKRLLPKEHVLGYKVYYVCFPLKRQQELKNRCVSINRFNLLSYYDKDHGKEGQTSQQWIDGILQAWNITEANGDIVLLTMPRVLGYVFNPVSFWFCLDHAGQIRAVLSEVRNTFGERHCYVSFHDDQRPIEPDDSIQARKIFHVSPFMKVEGRYEFRFSYSEETIGVWINYWVENRKMLVTSLIGNRSDLTAMSAFKSFCRYPLVTLKVIAMIHYHALKLIIKGIRYQSKPLPPKDEVSR